MKHVRIRVTAEAAHERVVMKKEVLHIFVKELARGNMANRRVVQLVGAHRGISPSHVKIVAGYHSPNKTLAVSE